MTALRTFRRRLPARRHQRPTRLAARRTGGVATFGAVGPVAVQSAAHALTAQFLRDGETILLAIKPSRIYIFLSSFRFIAGVVLTLVVLRMWSVGHWHYFIDVASFSIASRVMWATLHWMGRLYVLTDRRILRVSGVLHVETFDCPLRKMARTICVRPLGERIFRLGSIGIFPGDQSIVPSAWQTIRRPQKVKDQIDTAIRRAKQNGGMADGA